MQRVALSMVCGLLIPLSACGTGQVAQGAAAGPSHPWQNAERTMGHQPPTTIMEHRFECGHSGAIRLRWRSDRNRDDGSIRNRGAVTISELDWNGRQPGPVEIEQMRLALAPFSMPRSASVSCEGNQNRLILEFWDAHDGVRRVAIRMDAGGFRLEPPPSDGIVSE